MENQSDPLWKSWVKHYEQVGIDPSRICKDGILNSREWTIALKKVLFVLKEVNDWEGGDLKNHYLQGPRKQMWHTISRWSAGIQKVFPPFDKIDNWDSKKEAIQKIAAINLKKTSGGANSDSSVINAYCKQDSQLLNRQIDLIKPDVIVTCGTFDSVLWLRGLRVNPDAPKDSIVIDKKSGALVVPWRHPGRVNNRKTYEELKQLFTDSRVG